MEEFPNPNDLSEQGKKKFPQESLVWDNKDYPLKKDLTSILMIQFSLILFCFFIHFIFSSFLTAIVFQADKLPPEIKNYSSFELKQVQTKLEKELIEAVQNNPKIIYETFITQATSKSPSILLILNILWLVSYIFPAFLLFKYGLKEKFNLIYDEINSKSILFGLKNGINIFVLISFLSIAFYYFDIKTPIDNFQKELVKNLRANPYLLAWAIYTIAIITGLIEEIFFRGFLLHQFITHDKSKEGLLITSILFGAMHYSNEGSIISPIILSIVGFIFGFVYIRTRNIWASVSAHVIYNSLIILMAYFLGDKIYK